MVLGVLLATGGLLRLWLMVEWRPGFLGYPDTYGYIANSVPRDYFLDGLRPMGYPLFLGAARALSSNLSLTVLLQHALGIVAGLCAYGTARAFGAGRWAALLPAAVLLLHGPGLWFEHAILTEGVFGSLVCVALLPAALATRPERSPRVRLGLTALAGLLLAYAAAVRPIGIVLLPLVIAWAAWALPGPLRTRLAGTGAIAATGVGLVAANLVWAHAETGRYSLARSDYTAFYGRVAVFADCDKFDPPEGTKRLCPTTPERERPGPSAFVFSPESPLVKTFGHAGSGVTPADAPARVNKFSRAAVRGQPGDYLEAIGRDLVRLAAPKFRRNPNPEIANDAAGNRAAPYPRKLAGRDSQGRAAEAASVGLVATLYSTDGVHRGELGGLEWYERATRLDGLPWLVLLLLALAGPLALRGAQRRAALLVTAYALALTVAPIAAHGYDWRFQLVAIGPLAIAAGLGVSGLAALRRERQRPHG